MENNVEVVEITVEDTGTGIPPEKMSCLFEKFQQIARPPNTRHGGTGLGLVISRLLMEMMRGSISAVSIPGKGSAFTVKLPVWREGQENDGGEGAGLEPGT